MINAKQIHCGQYKRYGDFFRVWDIETDEPIEAVLEFCFTQLYHRRVPEAAEFKAAIKYPDGEHYGDFGYYFSGYHTIHEIENGYKFTICEPYAD